MLVHFKPVDGEEALARRNRPPHLTLDLCIGVRLGSAHPRVFPSLGFGALSDLDTKTQLRRRIETGA